MRKKIFVALGLAAIGGAAYFTLARNDDRKRPELTPSDVAWALDTSIWKIDFRNAGVFYGGKLVVVDGQGQTIHETGRFSNGDKPIALEEGFEVTIAARKDGSSFRGKLRFMQAGLGGTIDFSFDGILDKSGYGWVSHPKLDGDTYWLAGIGGTGIMGFGKRPFEEGTTQVGLRLIRTRSRE